MGGTAREPHALRVAHVMSSIAEEAAGPSYTVPALCDALAKGGSHTELHVLEAGPASRYLGASYELHIHPKQQALRFVDGSTAMRSALNASAQALDVFHTHGLWRMPGLYAAHAARRATKPLVISPRGMLEPAALSFSRTQKRVFWMLAQGRAIAGAQCLHATSETELKSLRELGLRNPIAVIGNAVEIVSPNANANAASRDTSTLLYLGRLHAIKGLDLLLEAWSTLEPRHPRWRLRMVGPSANGYRAALERRSKQLGLQRVSFGDAAFGADKRREFEAAQLYVLPSRSENFGMTVAEALAAGVPVVASRGTPWGDLESQGCGSWTDNTPKALASALDLMLRLPASELQAMGARGLAWMARDFSWQHKAAQALELYRWLARHQDTCPSFVDTVNGATRRGNRMLGGRWPAW